MRPGGVGFGSVSFVLLTLLTSAACGASYHNATDDVTAPEVTPIDVSATYNTAATAPELDAGVRNEQPLPTTTPAAAVTAQATPSSPTTSTPSSASQSMMGFPQQRLKR